MNHYIKNKNNRIMLPLSLLLVFGSCKKFIEVDPPKNQLVTSSVFSDSIGATSAVIGIYTGLNPYIGFVFGTGAITAYTGLAADELSVNGGSSDETQFYSNAIAINNSINNGSIWNLAYNSIYQTNACIEGLSASTSLSTNLKNQLVGEAKFLRAFIYFYLTNLYGDVPLISSTNYLTNSSIPRISINEVYQQIINDLIDAQDLLTTTYVTSGKVRVNKYTAQSLLARVYLFRGHWSLAENISTQIINAGTYSLEMDLNKVFLTGNTESIWQMPPYSLQGIETTEGYLFVPTSSAVIPSYIIRSPLLSSFESSDLRKIKWLNKNTITVSGSPTDFYYPYKYKLGYDGSTTPLENYVVFRLAEQYLIRAEARAQQNNLFGSTADLNIIRNRASLPNTSATSQSAIIAAILHERRVELFCEWGHRWFDLKRSGIIDSVLGSEKANWTPKAALFPIPSQQILVNPNLIQNPGY